MFSLQERRQKKTLHNRFYNIWRPAATATRRPVAPMMTCLLASDLADVDAEAEPEAVAPAGAPVLIVEDRVSL